MYGMVNKAVKAMIVKKHGEDAWSKIFKKAGSPSDFDAFEVYEDSLTYKLVEVTSEVMDKPMDEILRELGVSWVRDVALVHYKGMMESAGTDLLAFLQGIDHMHSRLKVVYPKFSPPSFRCKELEKGVCQLDYYSHRKGLLPFVEGLLEGLAVYFKVKIRVQIIPDKDHPMPCKRLIVSWS